MAIVLKSYIIFLYITVTCVILVNLGFIAIGILTFLKILIICDCLYDLKFKTSAFFIKKKKNVSVRY